MPAPLPSGRSANSDIKPEPFVLRRCRQIQSINSKFGRDKGAGKITRDLHKCHSGQRALENGDFQHEFLQTCKPILNWFLVRGVYRRISAGGPSLMP
jgi:hypothetical protein